MPIQPTQVFRGPTTTSLSTLHTVPAGKTEVVTEILAVNASSGRETYTVKLDGQPVVSDLEILPHTTHVINVRQVLAAGKTVTASATTTVITLHISGVTL